MVLQQIFVVSDLHLGGPSIDDGRRGQRICSHSSTLARFIRAVADLPSATAQLVINGDFVDFLLPTGQEGAAFIADPTAAEARLQQIVNGYDAQVFLELRRLLTRGHTLRILLGNHDLELALPKVKEVLAAALGIAPHNLWLRSDAYTVGGAVIVHGNQYDAWNKVDYEALARYAAWSENPIGPPPRFSPPPGSCLVIEVMNPLKERYPFVDLLKPEEESVIPLLLLLEPEHLTRVAGSCRLLTEERLGRAKALVKKFLGRYLALAAHLRMGGIRTTPELEGTIEQIGLLALEADLVVVAGTLLQTMDPVDAEEFLCELYLPIHNVSEGGASHIDEDLVSISAAGYLKEKLGLLTLYRLRHSELRDEYERRLRALQRALRALCRDRSFDIGHESRGMTLRGAENLAAVFNARFVIFGHTHLAKQIQIATSPPERAVCYLNCGTWADLLRIPENVFSDNEVTARNALNALVKQLLEPTSSLPFAEATSLTYVRLVLDDNGQVTKAKLTTYPDIHGSFAV